jgi:hypothetical protein
MRKVTTIGKTETHETVLRLKESGEGSEVGGGARIRLDVDTPFGVVEMESLEGALAAEDLELVDPPAGERAGVSGGRSTREQVRRLQDGTYSLPP